MKSNNISEMYGNYCFCDLNPGCEIIKSNNISEMYGNYCFCARNKNIERKRIWHFTFRFNTFNTFISQNILLRSFGGVIPTQKKYFFIIASVDNSGIKKGTDLSVPSAALQGFEP